ncbi:50S ribosomal protein L11 methyltransferase [Rhodocyclus tenuis]|uniref:Ribosomal protein L11 methyltransferase n=1 Tax=Rhodocyclus gracilis TaxID=2929842 RepID=A0ABX0WLE4_9RHOO|nr:50S ribosomal protein L11 methyltransferase [Rhodocyclus gracilis]NJA89587.1 50S ribosomal protein L11 methyltransferase [Rhodocyclus gracilis]
MGWLSLAIETRCDLAESLADALMDAGALSASIEDADAGTGAETPQFGEPGSVTTPGWERSRVIALLASDANAAAILDEAAAAIGLAEIPAWTTDLVEEQDWVRLTQAQFEPIRVSERLWIVPSWHEAPDPEAIVLVLDPGMAFGTGSHPTTRLCLEWLEREVRPGDSLLDYGCGSGILAIAAARLGATSVSGIDIDPQALIAARDNAEANHVTATFIEAAEPLTTPAGYDIVVANILANPLRALAPALVGHVRPGGHLALSGILSEQADELIACYAPWISLDVADTRDGWVCLAGRRAD